MGRNKETMKRVLKFISPYKSKIIIIYPHNFYLYLYNINFVY